MLLIHGVILSDMLKVEVKVTSLLSNQIMTPSFLCK